MVAALWAAARFIYFFPGSPSKGGLPVFTFLQSFN